MTRILDQNHKIFRKVSVKITIFANLLNFLSKHPFVSPLPNDLMAYYLCFHVRMYMFHNAYINTEFLLQVSTVIFLQRMFVLRTDIICLTIMPVS